MSRVRGVRADNFQERERNSIGSGPCQSLDHSNHDLDPSARCTPVDDLQR